MPGGGVCDDPWVVTKGPEARIRAASWLCVAVLALALAGCGGTSLLPGHRHTVSARPVGQDGPSADPAKVAVIRGWARALQTGDLRAAAGYFHLPSVFANGGQTIEIHTRAQAELANATLTCGASFVSAFRQGRYVNVLFRLTDRAGRGGGQGSCGSGVGATARTDFLIVHGRIVAWLRAPSRPGDPGVPTAPGTTGPPSQAV